MKRLLLSLVLLASCSLAVRATGQAPDILLYGNKTYDLFSNPLESRYTDKNRPSFLIKPHVHSSGNWRGYVATWEIIDKKLYLIKINSWLCGDTIAGNSDCRQATLPDLFGAEAATGKVSASWFSGPLRVPDGKQLEYVHMGYGSVYERDIIFEVKNGQVIKHEIIDNTKRVLPSSLELERQELEKLRKAAETGPPPEKQIEVKNNAPVVAGEGWGSVRLGATQHDIEKLLGKGKNRSNYDDVYFIDFEEAGVQVSFNNSEHKVEAIFFYNHQRLDENFNVFAGETDKGIKWSSSEDDVLKAYGKPKNDFSGPGWRRLNFEGIDFRFENHKLVRIGIPGN